MAEARDKATACRKLLLEGRDPLADKQAERGRARLEAAREHTFKECAEKLIASHEAGWRNDKHRQQWKNTLATYAYPVIGDLAVADVDTALVLKVIEPIWMTKAETAGRVRGRIESVLNWATAREFRQGDNPARWRGHLDHLLPARRKVARVVHHAALPFAEAGAFMDDLRQREGISARALEFAILTATRTTETLRAEWSEFDLAAGLWTIPPDRMKAAREHRIALSERAVEILKSMPREDAFVFPGGRAGKPLSNMALLMQLRRMGRDDLTAHGFRSTFKDWASETTAYPNELVEMALAHVVSDKTEAAYRRGDMFEKRRRLMEDWATFCAQPPRSGTVVPMRGVTQ